MHEPRQCPAIGTVCKICSKPNHWAKACRSRTSARHIGIHQTSNQNRGFYNRPPSQKYGNKERKNRRSNVHDMRTEAHDLSDEDNLNIDSLDTEDRRNEIFTKVQIKVPEKSKTYNLRVKVDTGANANTMTMRSFRQLYPEKVENNKPKDGFLKRSKIILSAYGGTSIQQYGTIVAKCDSKSGYKDKNLIFFVVESEGPNILGLQACRDLGLVKINCEINTRDATTSLTSVDDMKRQYPGCFDTIGNFPGTFHITLEENATPTTHPPRKCPIHVKQDLQNELHKMEELGVIQKVTQPTDWLNSLAYSRKKNGKLRVCLNPKDLNKAIKRVHHKIPTIEEISHKFSGSQFFTKLDAQHGYWAIKLDEESSLLTTFNSPFGRYKFNRLPFGLSVSQDIYQIKMDQILEQCPGTLGISDDICVYGKTEEEHDRNLKTLMEVATKDGLAFISSKCHIKKKQISFFGLKWDSE